MANSNNDYIKETLKNFLDRETVGGLMLIAATILALIIGNSAWAKDYHHILEYDFIIGIENRLAINLTVEEWINDGLMVIFFVVAGLEIKREMMVGELSSLKKASMPLLGALGGMVVPACIYLLINAGEKSADGWAIPMATDIAYALGILGLLGKRTPIELKIFLVALAIIDDIGAILIIAVYYSSNIAWDQLAIAGGILLLLFILNNRGVKHISAYYILGILFWFCFLHSGIHPTIAGVLFALTVPIKPRLGSEGFQGKADYHFDKIKNTDFEKLDPVADEEQEHTLKDIRKDIKQAHPPLLRMENALSGFNAYFIIPVFAFANAGVVLDIPFTDIVTKPLGLGILLGLVLGKVLGISLFTYLGNVFGIAKKSETISWKHIIGTGFIAGIGFTMSLFITNLAFSGEMMKTAKISILAASLIACLLGVTTLLWVNKQEKKKS